MKKVTVYYFEKYDIIAGAQVRSKRPATLETIKECKGEVLKDTAKEVDASRIDGNGFLIHDNINN